MTNERFASLHAGILERGGAKAGHGGKVVKVALHSGHRPATEFGRFGTKATPIRGYLDHGAGSSSPPDQNSVDNNPGQYRRPTIASRPAALLPASVAAPKIAPAAMAAARPRSAPPVIKRRAMTLRLDGDSHHRLRRASTNTGRTCQDLLYAAMNRYLDAMGFKE